MWRKPEFYRSQLIEKFCFNYHPGGWFLFGSARSGLAAFLKSTGIGSGDEVVVSSYTCLAVPTAIVAVGATPVYVDINSDSLNLDKNMLWKTITEKTKAIIFQHTLGIPASIDEIKNEAYERDIILIEDCALAIGSKINQRLVGTIGDAAIFSMELSKTLSCGWGGLLLVNNPRLVTEMKQLYDGVPEQKVFSSTRDLLQTIISTWCYFPIFVDLPGKYLLWMFNKMGIFRSSTPSSEYNGIVGKNFIRKMGPAQTILAILQWRCFTKITESCAANHKLFSKELRSLGYYVHGEEINQVELVSNRVSFLVKNRREMCEFFQKKRIELGEWFDGPLTPVPSSPAFKYQAEVFPKAQSVACHVVNFPCHNRLSSGDIRYLIRVLKDYTQAHPDAISIYKSFK